MSFTDADVQATLAKLIDPNTKKDFVAGKSVKNIKISGDNLSLDIQLGYPAKSVWDEIRVMVENHLRSALPRIKTLSVNVSSKVVPHAVQRGVKLVDGVKNIIAVVSGKGGVGKSTVAANLALALSQGGAKVGLMDADIYGPSVPIMFGVRGERPMMMEIEARPDDPVGRGKGMIVPIERYGVKLISIGFLVDEKNAVVWRGPMASSAIKQFVGDVFWDELDYLVVDMPPGTGDIHLTLMQTVPVTGAVIVTTPQDVALADAKKGIAMFGQAQLNVPIIGLVENMSYFTPAELPENKYYIFGKDGGKRLADEYDLPFLGQIPLVQSIREGGDIGVPIMMGDDAVTKKAFEEFTAHVVRSIAMRNANISAEKIAETV